MKYYRKRMFILLVCSIGFMLIASCKTQKSGNPYIDAKERPSDKQRKEEQKLMKKGTKTYAKQMKKNKRDIQGNINSATKMKKKHRKITKNKRLKKAEKPSWRF